jgi:hypothetical protein
MILSAEPPSNRSQAEQCARTATALVSGSDYLGVVTAHYRELLSNKCSIFWRVIANIGSI